MKTFRILTAYNSICNAFILCKNCCAVGRKMDTLKHPSTLLYIEIGVKKSMFQLTFFAVNTPYSTSHGCDKKENKAV